MNLDRRDMEQRSIDNMPEANRALVHEYGFFDYMKAAVAIGDDPVLLSRYLAEQRKTKQRKRLGD